MVWHNKVPTVAMVTELEERGRKKCHQYWPDDEGMVMEHDDGDEEILVQNKGVEVGEGFDVTTLELERAGETRIVKHFWFRAWGE